MLWFVCVFVWEYADLVDRFVCVKRERHRVKAFATSPPPPNVPVMGVTE